MDGLYPSIRQLPILGVTYADLFRRTKIQETLFEVLTQQYELAKVQEVKETPSVKVLDTALVPEKKSFPPRTMIVLLGTFLAFAGGVVWVFVHDVWRATDERDPVKLFVLETYGELKNKVRAGAPANWRRRHDGEKVASIRPGPD